jgi:hypothetical protein
MTQLSIGISQYPPYFVHYLTVIHFGDELMKELQCVIIE